MFRTLVIFDVDGTLVRSMAMETECYASAFCDHLGIDAIGTDWDTYPRGTDPGIAVTLYERHCDRAPLASELEAFHDLFADRIRTALARDSAQSSEVPGACALLRLLRADARFELAIATGAWRRPVMLKLAAAGIDIAGLPFACADDAIDRVEIARKAVARSSGRFDRLAFVGDTVSDVRTARTLGIGFLGIGTGAGGAALRAAGASAVLVDFLDVPSVVELLLTVTVPLTP